LNIRLFVLHPVTPIVLDVGVGGIITDVAAKPAIAVGVFDVHVFAAIWVVFVVICTFPIPLLTDVMRPSPPTVMLGFVYVPAETPLAGNVTELLKDTGPVNVWLAACHVAAPGVLNTVFPEFGLIASEVELVLS
jgi:hypothetical protein